MLSTLAKDETIHFVNGPAGQLEMVKSPAQNTERNVWGIVCHPHPLHGGTMNNKVVTTLVKTFQGLGVNTVRFNFRGVGQSEGKFDGGNGELDDLYAVMNWLQQENLNRSFWIAGFSFGAFIAAKAASQLPIQKLVTVAPPVENFPMGQIPPISAEWVLVQGEKDEVVSAESVLKWAHSRDPQPHIIVFPDATHFFHGQLTQLRTELEKALGA